jgi:UDP-N-acetylmuramyl tripeptide synthase
VEKLLGYGANYAVLPHEARADQANHLAIAEHQIISFGTDHEAEATIGVARLYRKGTEVHVTIDHQTNFTLASYLVGSLNARNVAAAIATAYVLGADTKTFEEGVAGVELVEGNYQYVDQDTVYTVAVDGARYDESLKEVVKSARALTKRRLTVVIDGIIATDDTLEDVKSHADRVIITTGDDSVRIGVEIAHDQKHAVEIALRGARKDDTVLFVGPAFAAATAHNKLWAEELLEHHG